MEEDAITDGLLRCVSRCARGAFFAITAFCLLGCVTYNIRGYWLIGIAIGALGLTNLSARIAVFGLTLLLLMALIPKETILFFANL